MPKAIVVISILLAESVLPRIVRADPTYTSICNLPGTSAAMYNKYCVGAGGAGRGGVQNTAPIIQQQQQQDAAAAQAAAEKAARQEELDRQQDERRRADYIRSRDDAAETLKGAVGPAFADTGIKDIKPEEKTNDLGGRRAAWKQLHCAASIAFDAMFALQASMNDPSHDTSEYHYLSGEAAKALGGGSLGVQCPAAPPIPTHRGKPINSAKGKVETKRILESAKGIADRIEQGPALSTQPKKEISDLIQHAKKVETGGFDVSRGQ